MQTLIWSVAMYGCESWIIKAADSKRLNAFEMDMYRRMMRISWREHRTNNSIIEGLQPTCRFLAEIKRRKLQYFGHVVRADNLCIHILHVIITETDVEEDHGDAGLMISNSWQEYPLQIVFNVQETEACGDPWCPCRWPPILKHEEGPRQEATFV